MGFPIRKFTDQSLFAAPHDLSQRTTSFIASQRQGIHRILLRHLIALIIDAHPSAEAPRPLVQAGRDIWDRSKDQFASSTSEGVAVKRRPLTEMPTLASAGPGGTGEFRERCRICSLFTMLDCDAGDAVEDRRPSRGQTPANSAA